MSEITFMFIALALALTAWFWITNTHIDDRANRIEKMIKELEGKEK